MEEEREIVHHIIIWEYDGLARIGKNNLGKN